MALLLPVMQVQAAKKPVKWGPWSIAKFHYVGLVQVCTWQRKGNGTFQFKKIKGSSTVQCPFFFCLHVFVPVYI